METSQDRRPSARRTRAVGRRMLGLAWGAALATMLGAAHATLVTFDDLTVTNWPASMWDAYADPIDPQAYASKGLLIQGGYLWPNDFPHSQTMRVAPQTTLTFQGASLPTFVSLHLRWLPEDVLDLRVSGPSGYAATFHSFGYGDGPSVPPGFGDQTLSFHSEAGISTLSFADSRFMRFPAWVDNVYFGNVPAVPEPQALALLAIGLLVLGTAHRRARS